MHWYYNLLVRRPYLVVLAISVLCLACIIVSFAARVLPDFTNPLLGFETRGTEISRRLTAWNNLNDETESRSLVANPNEYSFPPAHFNELAHRRKLRRNRNRKRKNKRKQKARKLESPTYGKKVLKLSNQVNDPFEDYKDVENRLPTQWNGDNGIFHDYEITNDSWASTEHSNRSEHIEYGQNKTSVDEDFHRERVQTKKSTWRILKQAASGTFNDDLYVRYFCDSPHKNYAHFVIERIGPNATDTLFDLNSLLAMCQLQEQITGARTYDQYCQKEMSVDECCRPWSLANYATLLANKSSCFELTSEDVSALQNLLVTCFDYFHDLKLFSDCSEHNRCYAPHDCKRQNIVFNILHFLTDINFIKNNDSSVFLKYAMIFVPVARSTKILQLFHEWEKIDLKNDILQVSAIDVGLENELFNECLLNDAWLLALGSVFVMTCIWLYTTSIFITIMTCVAVFFSVGLAYFLYTLVFELSFFPYMNLLAIVVIIGIGADGAFIFVKVWQCVLAERFNKTTTVPTSSGTTIEDEYTETLQNLMALTLRHAAPSIFVSSLTTACAFYSSHISSITAIKCFGIFAGTAVAMNFLLMITWLPACVSIMERLSACSKLHVQKLLLMFHKSITKFYSTFEATIIRAVLKYAWIWIALFGITGICSTVVVVYWPGLQLPESAYFQLFVSKHPFEVYNMKLKNEFWFEKSVAVAYKLPLRFVWGVLPIDDGDYSNPFSHGTLHYDNNFNVSTKAAQKWLFNFCQDLKQQPFYEMTFGLLLPNCFIENFISTMSRLCIDDMGGTNRSPCCDITPFPYEPYIFDICLPQSIAGLYATPRSFFLPGVAGPKFSAPRYIAEGEHFEYSEENSTLDTASDALPVVKALVIEFESNVSLSASYSEMTTFVNSVEKWFQMQLQIAPAEMKGGWFTSNLTFFDVQRTLSRDTILAISVALCTSLVILFLVTLNVLISLYAVLTVSLTIFTTVAVLILLGWELNVLESIAVCTAIGLVVDFSLHYSIHYRLSAAKERIAATEFALSRIIGPTAMAAVTTGVAGSFMLASSILPYIQIGVFLVIVTSVSWLYATFFLMSLLKVAGPEYGFMQFALPISFHKRPAINGIKYYERKQSQVVANEQLLTPSSSAVGDLINSETHELESLTSNSLIKTICGSECPNLGSGEFEHSFQGKYHGALVHNTKQQPTANSSSVTLNYLSPTNEMKTTALPSNEAASHLSQNPK